MHFWIFTIFFLFYIEILPTVHTQFHTLKKMTKNQNTATTVRKLKQMERISIGL